MHGEVLRSSKAEKYLGDIISENGSLDDTIKQRKLRGYSYISEIRALLSDMPFGSRRVEVGLMLRNAMFVNGILCNSEAWHSISKKHIEDLEVMDRSLLRYITGAHVKTKNEFLYLETGVLNIEKIISNRRMMYFQTIIKRDEDELTKRIYVCQKNNPVKGDWIELVKKDFADLEIDMDEELISKETKSQFKTRIRNQLKTHMLAEMKQQQAGHS